MLLQTGKQIVSKLNNTAAISTSYILVSLINSVKIERRVYAKYASRNKFLRQVVGTEFRIFRSISI